MNRNTKKMCIAALFASLCAVATLALPVKLPTGGYANLGDAVVILSGLFLGPVYGFAAAGIGSVLADVFLGYFNYAVATFFIKGLMAFAACCIYKSILKVVKKVEIVPVLISALVSEIIMVVGYFVFECFLYGLAGAVSSLPGNSVQAIFGMFAGTVLFFVLKKTLKLFL